MPGEHGDAAPGEPPEQGRAPAFAIEDQGYRRCAGLRPVEHTEPLQRRDDIMLKGTDQLRIQRLVQAEQRLAAEGVDPVTGAGRQAQLLARDEALGKTALAAGIDLDVAIDTQGRPAVGIPGLPLAGQRRLPGPDPGLVLGDHLDLGAQGLRFGRPVVTENGAPFPRCVIAQAFRRADPGHEHERDAQEDGRKTVVPPGQWREEFGGAQKAFPEQGRQGGEHATARHAARRCELRGHRTGLSDAGQHPSDGIAGRPSHHRLAVTLVTCAPVAGWLGGRTVVIPVPPAADQSLVDPVVDRCRGDTERVCHRSPAQSLGQQPGGSLGALRGQGRQSPSPAPLEEGGLAAFKEEFPGPFHGRAGHAEDLHQMPGLDAVDGAEPADAHQHRGALTDQMEVQGLEVRVVLDPLVTEDHCEAAGADLDRFGRDYGEEIHRRTSRKYVIL